MGGLGLLLWPSALQPFPCSRHCAECFESTPAFPRRNIREPDLGITSGLQMKQPKSETQ